MCSDRTKLPPRDPDPWANLIIVTKVTLIPLKGPALLIPSTDPKKTKSTMTDTSLTEEIYPRTDILRNMKTEAVVGVGAIGREAIAE